MRGLLRALVAIASIGAGSWVGLHAPFVPLPAKTWGPPPSTSRTPASEPKAARDWEREPSDPLPPDTSVAGGAVPWPRLNPEVNVMKAWRLAEGPHRAPGDRRRLVTLTFDDGPFPETTPKVLDLLAQYGVRATFFVVGRYLEGDDERARASRAVLKQITDAGHLVGNHTRDHALLTAASHTQVLEQIDRASASIERVTGKRPFLFRPPFGELDDFGQEAVRARQLDLVLWSVEARDMERSDTHEMFRDLVRQLSYNEGGIVLLHDIRWTSVSILKRLLAYLDARRYDPHRPDREGYAIVDLPAYLRAVEASPPQPGARDRSAQPPLKPSHRRAESPTNLPSRAWAGQKPPPRI